MGLGREGSGRETHRAALGFDERTRASVHLLVEAARVAQVVALTVASPQRSLRDKRTASTRIGSTRIESKMTISKAILMYEYTYFENTRKEIDNFFKGYNASTRTCFTPQLTHSRPSAHASGFMLLESIHAYWIRHIILVYSYCSSLPSWISCKLVLS